MEEIIQLRNRIINIDKFIDEYTILRQNVSNNFAKRNYEFFIDHLVKQKLDIEELITEIKESELEILGFL